MKKWLTRIIICLVLGALTTVAVAIFFSVLGFKSVPLGDTWSDGDPDDPSWYRLIDPFALPESAFAERARGRCMADWQISELTSTLRNAIEKHETLSSNEWTPNQINEFQAGWPLPALSGQIQLAYCSYPASKDIEHLSVLHGFVLLRGTADELLSWEPEVIAVPFIPVWIGFLLDTLFFSTGWLAANLAFGLTRQLLRKRRGRCPKCAYILEAGLKAGCPECGWNRGRPAAENR